MTVSPLVSSDIMLRLQGSRENARLNLLHKAQNISSAAERQSKPRATLTVRMHDLAKGTVALLAQFALYPDVLASHRAKALDDRGYGVKLSVLQARHEAVATSPHPAYLWTVEGEVELALVGLRNT